MSILGRIIKGAGSILASMRVTIGYLFKKKVTVQYPEVRPQLSTRFRGLPALPIDPETGRDRCIACSACARVCPDNVISVTQEVGEDKKRYAGSFSIDAAGCIFCGLCVEVCPTHALVMSDEFELAHSTREDLVIHLEKLHEIGGYFPPKPAPEPATELSAENKQPEKTAEARKEEPS